MLSEAKRRKLADELEVVWLAREGWDWAVAKLDGWMQELQRVTFVPKEAADYLEARRVSVIHRRERLSGALNLIRTLANES